VAAAGDGIGLRLGGLVDRTAAIERLAERASPLATRAASTAPVVAPERAPAPASLPDAGVTPYAPIRKRTATHLRESLDTAAHALIVADVDYGALDRVRRELGLTYLPFVARAVVEAARAFPNVNATSTADGLRVSREVHLGIAVDLGFEGLVVPVVRNAGDLRLRALAGAIEQLAAAARDRRLSADALEGGTFTITNVGNYGTVSATPIINYPQVAILSVDGIRMRPAAVPGPDGEWALAVRPLGNLSLSFDHRVFDGAYAAAFLDRVRTELQDRDWDAER
jgi:2-oxoglutarate dehydrogenase E2 component (dihydrolipoamide succinyltransferase)